MQVVNKVTSFLTRAANNNVVVDVFLVSSFSALCFRSMSQQKYIETLESEKESVAKINKGMRKTMWDWKQQLFAEAASDSALVPLAKLKAIYGEAPDLPIGNAAKENAKLPTSVVVV